ncbi:hypothetical protein EGW08_007250 [Elysia chlorotica]|uniref:Uncharacterized protein n=1 Tax=Elysia chlorotica TaxID=188477 RepID=A0A3S1BJC5_ELYCH|nr:hypothetical protein EGW08_007250 [Elysia chlorotica]
MALFETELDGGSRCLLDTAKLRCAVCKNIKPCFNLEEGEPGLSGSLLETPESQPTKLSVCQCPKESYVGWIKRLFGFGPSTAHSTPRESFLSKIPISPKVVTFTKSPFSIFQEKEKEKVEPVECEIVPSLSLQNVKLSPLSSKEDNAPDVKADADLEDQSQASKEPKFKKKNRCSLDRNIFRSDTTCGAAYNRQQLNKYKKKYNDIPLSTANVFHSYRSRALYCLQPLHVRKLSAIKKKSKKNCAMNGLASKNTTQSALPNEPEDRQLTEHDGEPKTDTAETEGKVFSPSSCSVGKSYCVFHCPWRWQRSPASYHSGPSPYTDRYYGHSYRTPAMFSGTRSFCEPVRPRSVSAPAAKTRPSIQSCCCSAPYPVVLPGVAKCGRRPARGRREGRHATQAVGRLCGAFGEEDACRSRDRYKMAPGGFRDGVTSTKRCENFGRFDYQQVKTSERSPLPTRRGFEPAQCDKCAQYSGWKNAGSPKGKQAGRRRPTAPVCCQLTLPLKPRTKSSGRKRGQAGWDTGTRLSVKPSPPRSCPPICIGRSLSPCPFTPRPYRGNRVQCSASQALAAESRFLCSLNSSQSSNAAAAEDTSICAKCRTPIKFKKRASAKLCKCEFVLAPTCLKRRGPRSTVTEYLSTIEHPKPRFAPSLVSSRHRREEALAEQQQEMDDSGRGKGNGKAAKKNDKVDPERGPSSQAKAELTRVSSETSQPKAASSTPPVSAQAPQSKVKDGNNNYGPGDRAAYAPAARVSSVPSYAYTSLLDSGYSRGTPSPYSASYGVRHSHENSAAYPASSGMGYLQAAQEYRRSIRHQYEKRHLIADRSSTQNNANLNAWHPSSLDSQVSQFQSWSPTVKINLHPESPEKPRRARGGAAHSAKLHGKNLKQAAERNPARQQALKVFSVPDRPPIESAVAPFFPRKSFPEGENPIGLLNLETLKAERAHNQSERKVLRNVRSKAEAAPVVQQPTDVAKQEADAGKESLEGAADAAPAPTEARESGQDSHCETREEATGQQCGARHVEEISLEKDVAGETEQVREENTQHKDEAGETEQVREENTQIKDVAVEKSTGPQIPVQAANILPGKESCVDCEPEVEPRVVPRGRFLKILLPDSSSASSAATTATTSALAPSADTASPFLKAQEMQTVPNSTEGRQVGEHILPGPYASSSSQVPVFQSLMDRFGETVQILVRTKGGDKQNYQGYDGDVDRGSCSSAISLEEVTDAAKENMAGAPAAGESVAACSAGGKSRNKPVLSGEATSNCVSWSDLIHLSPTDATQQASGTRVAADQQAASAAPTASPATVESYQQASITPVPSTAIVTANETGDGAASGPASKGSNFNVKVEILTSTEHVYMKKPAEAALASVRKILPRSMVSPVDLGDKELGQGEELASKLALLAPARKSHSYAASVRRRLGRLEESSPGSSVDPPRPPLTEDILEAASFHRLTADVTDGTRIRAAKSRFLRSMRAESMTQIRPATSSLSATVTRGLDGSVGGALTDAMKKLISLHGTPV